MNKRYEFTYLTRQDMTETDAKSFQDKLVASIQAKQGVVLDMPKSYKKRLAYRIKRQDAAFVNTILFQMEPSALLDFKKETDAMPEILRSLVIFYNPSKIKREPRQLANREQSAEAKTEEPASAEIKEEAKPEPVEDKKTETVEVKKETKKEEKEAKEEKKESKKEEKKEEAKETKTAKPRTRKPKAKAELQDIEEKLEEILK